MGSKRKLPIDKMLHYFIMYWFATIVYPLVENLWYTVLIITIAAVGKEIYDYFKKGSVEMLDIMWTIFGGLSGVVEVALLTGKL